MVARVASAGDRTSTHSIDSLMKLNFRQLLFVELLLKLGMDQVVLEAEAKRQAELEK